MASAAIGSALDGSLEARISASKISDAIYRKTRRRAGELVLHIRRQHGRTRERVAPLRPASFRRSWRVANYLVWPRNLRRDGVRYKNFDRYVASVSSVLDRRTCIERPLNVAISLAANAANIERTSKVLVRWKYLCLAFRPGGGFRCWGDGLTILPPGAEAPRVLRLEALLLYSTLGKKRL